MQAEPYEPTTVPTWVGSLATLISFERDLAWYIVGTVPDKRGPCGPRIARALTGRAMEVVTDTTT